MKTVSVLIAATIALLLICAPAEAKNSGKLPKDAVPLTEAEAIALFSGKTIKWKPAMAYFSKDGTQKGFYPVKGKESFAEGTWKVRANEVCYRLEWRWGEKAKEPYVDDNCALYYKSSGKIWTKNTKDKDEYMGDIWMGIEKKLVPGDQASAKADALKKKLGY